MKTFKTWNEDDHYKNFFKGFFQDFFQFFQNFFQKWKTIFQGNGTLEIDS